MEGQIPTSKDELKIKLDNINKSVIDVSSRYVSSEWERGPFTSVPVSTSTQNVLAESWLKERSKIKFPSSIQETDGIKITALVQKT